MKNDIHVLNWKNITQNTCTKPQQSTNKGILFEDLIEKLLAAMFPKETWRRTIKSHDGKKDFVYPYEETLPEQKWAECKNYSSNLSINVIAPTLIMGTIEKIESIFFFSYSPLNDNAIEGLLRYSEVSKRNVEIFDGNVLESLICKYHNLNSIGDFFPNTDFQKAYAALNRKKFRIIKIYKDINGNKLSPLHLFELGESFYISVIIQNLTYEQNNYTIHIESNKKNLLQCDISKHCSSLPFAGFEEYSVQCQTLEPGNVNCKIIVQNPQVIFKSIKKVRIIDEPYLFWTGKNAFEALKQCEQHLSSYNKIPLLISAQSGMGKSTLINILSQEKNILAKYRTLKIDLNLTRNCCVKNLFSLLTGLHNNDEIPKDQVIDCNNTYYFLLGNYAESAKMIADTIFKFYDYSYPYLFIMDDIQKIDRSYITLLHELNEKSKSQNKPIYYIFTLNESVCSIETLFSRLRWNLKEKNRKCVIVNLKKFEKNDVISFLKHKFGLQKIDNYFVNFNREISPLELHSLCITLKSERIIAPIPNSKTYQIVDLFKFKERICYICYSDISLKNICESMEKGDIPEYILKYLYLADKINSQLLYTYPDIIKHLISLGILKEIDGQIEFCHAELRKQIGEKFVFSEEDYADIYASSGTDAITKALCALNQIGRIRNSISFLREFFCSNFEIQKKNHRFEICSLIFKNLNQITKYGLTSQALNFVKNNYSSLNIEQGHSKFWSFLKQIADSALISNWDTDEESVENMSFFIKKFFDRSLSTYNYQNCMEYYEKFKNIFCQITNISDSRRFFWLSHYANRVAIALDRASAPLSIESDKISEMYAQSKKYCENAGSDPELLLQITVDDFNRHYIYKHNLSLNIVQSTYKRLREIKETFHNESIFLEYHLLLLKYLNFKMCDEARSEVDYFELRTQIVNARKKCVSAFYIFKLYILEIYILIDIRSFEDASAILNETFEHVYKREMKSYIYKLTYIKAYILEIQNTSKTEHALNPQIILAFDQIIDQHKNAPNALLREIFLIVRLARSIEEHKISCIKLLPSSMCKENRNLMQKICKYIKGEQVEKTELFNMPSYFIFNNISFPNI